MDQLRRIKPAVEPQPHGRLTETSRFRLAYLPAPPALAQHVTTFYHFTCEEADIREMQPASVGHLALFPHGQGAIHFADGRSEPLHEVSVLTPFSLAAPFTVAGPFHAIGAALTPLGWAELTGLHAGKHGNRFRRAGEYLGEALDRLGEQWCAAYRAGAMDAEALVAKLAEWIGAHLKPLGDGHRALVGTVISWLGSALDPPLAALFAASPYSQRQTQRLVERFFGLPPTALKRKYRALRAAAMLSQPALPDAVEAEVREAFYDQPHMIRELRLFTGRTPARLSDEPDSYLAEMLDPRNLRELGLRG